MNVIATSAFNKATGCWEVIERERSAATSLDDVDLSADDLGCPVGESFRVQLFIDGRMADETVAVAR